MSEKLSARFNDFSNAVDRLDEAVARDWVKSGDTLVRDGLIQRFEVAFDTAWKFLKHYLGEVHTIEVPSPLVAIQEAHRLGLLADVKAWIAMKNRRNQTSHIYSEKLAVEVAMDIGSFADAMRTLRDAREGEYAT